MSRKIVRRDMPAVSARAEKHRSIIFNKVTWILKGLLQTRLSLIITWEKWEDQIGMKMSVGIVHWDSSKFQ